VVPLAFVQPHRIKHKTFSAPAPGLHLGRGSTVEVRELHVAGLLLPDRPGVATGGVAAIIGALHLDLGRVPLLGWHDVAGEVHRLEREVLDEHCLAVARLWVALGR